ncbi:MAG: hypothetical protein HYY17_04555 [Planctomycetes bacterium]|nr:hypothetical protein [Planctomycetota bacterium]
MLAKLVLRSLWGRRGRMAVAWAALAVPAALVTGAANFLLDASAKLRTEVRTGGPNLVVRAVGEPVPAEALGRFRSWRHAGRLDGTETVRAGERKTAAPSVRVDPARAAAVWTWWRVDGTWPREGEALLGRRLAERLRLRRGDEVEVGGRRRTVCGVLENEGEEERAVVLGEAPLRFTRAEFVLDADAAGVERAAAEIRREVPGVAAEPVRALTSSQAAVADRLRVVFGFVVAFVLALSGLGIAATFAALVQEQRREIGLVAALGAGPGRVARFLAAQGGVLLLAALVAGAALGLGLSDLLGRRVFGMGTSVRPLALAAALGACAVTAALGLVVPVRRALAVEPAAVLREE